MLELWRKRLTIAGLSLRHEDPRVFVVSQWQRQSDPNVYYMIYRVLMTCYLLAAWVLSIVDEEHLHEPFPFHLKWLIYLTNWGFTFCTLQAALCTGMLAARFRQQRWRAQHGGGGGDGLVLAADMDDYIALRFYKLYWFCFTIALDLSVAVTLLYWIMIYNPATMPLDYLNIMVHCTNSAAMLIELCVVSHPVRLLHFYVGLSSGVTYTIFSLIYHFAGGTSRLNEPFIYPVVDWNKPTPTIVVCAGACVLLIIIHCSSFLVYKVRARIARALLGADAEGVIAGGALPVQETFRGFDNDSMANECV